MTISGQLATGASLQVESLADKEFRHIHVSDHIRELLAAQIREMREQRGWSQAELGINAGGMAQERVSLLEDPDYAGVTLKTLKRIGEAFDVALLVEYVPFSEFIGRIKERHDVTVPSYDVDLQRIRYVDVSNFLDSATLAPIWHPVAESNLPETFNAKPGTIDAASTPLIHVPQYLAQSQQAASKQKEEKEIGYSCPIAA